MRYGKGKYNTFKYGVKDNSTIGWKLLIRWDDIYWYPETDRIMDLVISRGRDNMITGNKLEGMGVGEATLTLDNTDGRYDPFNASSPIYAYIGPGKRAKVIVKNGDNSNEVQLIEGTISQITPYGRREKTQIKIVDDWNYLKGRVVNQGLTNNWRVDLAINDIIADAGGLVTLNDMSSDFIKHFWEAKMNAADGVNEIAHTFMDEVIIGADGVFKYKAHNKIDASKLTITSEKLLKDIAFPMPWEVQRNFVKVTVHPVDFSSTSSTVIWELKSAIPILDGQSIEMDVEFNVNNIKCLAIPDGQYGVGLSCNTSSDGSGVSIYPSYSCQYYGSYAHISLINNTGQDGYILPSVIDPTTGNRSGSYAVGFPYLIYENQYIQAGAGSWQTNPTEIDLDSVYMQDNNQAIAIANYMANWLNGVKYFPTIIVDGRPDWQFSLDLLDKVRLDLGTLNIDDYFRVGKITIKWLSDNGQLSRTEFKLEPVKPFGDYWELDVDALDSTTILGV